MLGAAARALPRLLRAALALDNQDPGLWCRVGYVFITGISYAHATRGEALDPFLTAVPVMHVDRAVEDDDLRSIVHMPGVRLLSPVQSDCRAVNLGEVQRAPGMIGGEAAGVQEAHALIVPATRARGDASHRPANRPRAASGTSVGGRGRCQQAVARG